MRWWPCALVVLLLISGCSRGSRVPDLGKIYERAAMQSDLHRNPVIVIPGILGSKLARGHDGPLVWGAFGGGTVHPGTGEGARTMALPMEIGKPLNELRDDVVVTGALDRIKVSVFGISLMANAYFNILMTLGAGGYRDQQLEEAGAIDYGTDHFTCFQFAYDWRRDIVENARLLHDFIEEKKKEVRAGRLERFGDDGGEVRFDIVAHSMGGLLTRYYLRYGDQELSDDGALPEVDWRGAHNVHHAILVGTPSAGSLLAATQLIDGADFVPVIGPHFDAAILGTYPTIYQLLPRARHGAVVDAGNPDRHLDILDPALWKSMGWGLADPDQDPVLERLLPDAGSAAERRRIALEHQGKCLNRARRLHEALDVPAPRPEALALHLIAGDSVDTVAIAEVDRASGDMEIRESGPGDGTVLRTSALMDERVGGEWRPRLVSPVDWAGVLFIFRDHIGITKDPAFTDNVLYHLLEEPGHHH